MSISDEIKVFIVEDDPMVQRIIKEFIHKVTGFTVAGTAKDYDSALDSLQSVKVDLVLLDIYLPGGLGIDLLKWIRVQDYDMDAILITADTKTSTLENAMRYGAADYLIKPFLFERFEEALERYRYNKSRINHSDVVSQAMVDQVINANKKHTADEPKNQTAESILSFLESNSAEGYTSSEVAKALGISRITARRYLEEMEKNGKAVLELSYGGVGRPQNKYHYVFREESE